MVKRVATNKVERNIWKLIIKKRIIAVTAVASKSELERYFSHSLSIYLSYNKNQPQMIIIIPNLI